MDIMLYPPANTYVYIRVPIGKPLVSLDKLDTLLEMQRIFPAGQLLVGV